MSRKQIIVDVLALGALIYGGLWFFLWYTQQLWAVQGMTPSTAFTDGHLITISVGRYELLYDTMMDLHTDRVGWPKGLIFLPLMWPTILLSVWTGAAEAYNYTYLSIPIFNLVCGYMFGRAAGAGWIGASVCAVLTSWNPWVRETLGNGQFEQAGVGLISLTWACGLWAERRVLFGGLAMGCTVLLGGVAAPNCIFAALLGLPVLGAGRVLITRRHLPSWVFCAVTTLAAALLVNAYHSANFNDLPQFFRPRRADDASMINTATLESLWTSPSKAVEQFQVIHCTFLGTFVLYASVLSLLSYKRGLLMMALVVWMALLSMGPTVSLDGVDYSTPMAWIEYFAPIIQESGSYYRITAGTAAALAVAAGVGVMKLRQFFWPLGAVAAIWICHAHIEQINTFNGHKPPIKARAASWNPELVALKGGKGAVFDLPLVKQQGCDKNVFNYLNSYELHQRPYVHTMEPPILYRDYEVLAQRLQRTLRSEACEDKLDALVQKMQIGALVVHTDLRCALKTVELSCLKSVLGSPNRGSGLLWWDNLLER